MNTSQQLLTGSDLVEGMGDKVDLKSLQKTCHIYTVNLGHVAMTTENSEEEQMDALRAHHDTLSAFPNVKIVRAQIERNSNGNLHVNGGVKLTKPIRARTLENKLGGWFEPAKNEKAVMVYGRKQETRVALLPNKGELKVKKTATMSPKAQAIEWLIDGLDPAQICAKSPEVYFTHHKSIIETWKMMQITQQMNRSDLVQLPGETEEQ